MRVFCTCVRTNKFSTSYKRKILAGMNNCLKGHKIYDRETLNKLLGEVSGAQK